MERVRFLEHNGKEVLLLDFSHCSVEAAFDVIEKASAVIRAAPPESLLTLSDFTGIIFAYDLHQKLKEFTALNKPHVRAAAVVGVTGLKKTLLEGVMLFSQRRLPIFENREAAKAWLVDNYPSRTEP